MNSFLLLKVLQSKSLKEYQVFFGGIYQTPAGLARSNSKEHIAWNITADSELLALVEDGDKRLLPLAGAVAHSASKFGITEITVLDYDLAQMVKDCVT